MLPRLREDIDLQPGPSLHGGAPSWTLHDAARNKFFRIGSLEFEILARWHFRRAQTIADAINRDTLLAINVGDVERVLGFLDRAELLQRPDVAGTAQLLERKRAARRNWLSWLTHSYLFIRIPLLRPEPALRVMLPLVSWVYGRVFMLVSLLAGMTGLVLIMRQWDGFLAALPWFFSLEGALVAGLALFASKALHEIAHGLTAVRYGCRVPSMGVALLVLAPVLYTDTSAAWGLRDRRQRLAIGAAGVVSELYLAMYALLLWNVLPDGMLRSAVYVWATTTWVLTVLINASPFLRFDGYYLLSDAIDVPNLQDRSFALARHRIRRLLFGFPEAPPEHWPARMASFLTLYAITTWFYRFFLFLGIALLVYHLFFKALGVVLFAVEIWYFILRPVVRELGEWSRGLRRHGPTRSSAVTFVAAAAIIAVLLVPWRTSLHLPAVMVARERVQLYAPTAGRVEAVEVRVGTSVIAGQVVVRLNSPDLDFRLGQAQRSLASLQAQALALTTGDPSSASILQQRITSARVEVTAFERERDRMVLRAPFDGVVTELAEPLGRGEWIKAGEPIAFIADLSTFRIDAYVEEADLRRVEQHAEAVFVPADMTLPRIDAQVSAVEEAAARALVDPELASRHGGPIAVRQTPNGDLIPEIPVYRVRIQTQSRVGAERTLEGTAIITAKSTSIATSIRLKVLGLFNREFGF